MLAIVLLALAPPQPDAPPRFVHEDSVFAVAFAPDGQSLASAGIDRVIRLWKTSSGELLRTVGRHEGRILALQFSPDGKLLASTSSDLKVHLWNPQEGKLLRTLDGHSDTIQAVAFSPDGKFVATSALDQTIRLWDAHTGKVFRSIEYPDERAPALVFTPDGQELLVGFNPAPKVRAYSVTSGKSTREWSVQRSGDLTGVAVAGNYLVACTASGALLRADLLTNQAEKVGTPSSNGALSLAASADGKLLLVGGARGEIDLIETATLKGIRTFDSSTSGFHVLDRPRRGAADVRIRTVGFSPTAEFLVAGNELGYLRVWRTLDLIPKQVFTQSKLTDKELADAWAALANADPALDYVHLARLGAYPEQALPYLAGRFQPAPPVDEKQVRAWIAQLDDDDFAVREKAHQALRGVARAAEPILRGAKNLPAEAARRVQELLEPLAQAVPEAERLRDQRLVLLLQLLGSPEACKLLDRLATGGATAPLTRDARAALDRLGRSR